VITLSEVRWKGLWITLLAGLAVMLLMDSCMQFRMSRSEIDRFFCDKKFKGTLHQYRVGQRTVNYLHVGDTTKPVVVFMHGSPGSLSAFIDFMADSALLAQAQLISVDRPGFGSSDFGRAEKSLAAQSALLFPVLEKHKRANPLVLVGHSLGGPVIAQMAMDYPQWVDGLVIVAGSIDPALEPHEWFRAPLATPMLKWMMPRSLRASNDEIYRVKPQLEAMLPRWQEITIPVTVIQGGNDKLVPPGNAHFAKRMLVNAPVQLVLIDDMNHFVPWTHPHLIRAEVLEMIKSLTQP
jgi:pimeloyl-ACP methyl ester carboxylesterase